MMEPMGGEDLGGLNPSEIRTKLLLAWQELSSRRESLRAEGKWLEDQILKYGVADGLPSDLVPALGGLSPRTDSYHYPYIQVHACLAARNLWRGDYGAIYAPALDRDIPSFQESVRQHILGLRIQHDTAKPRSTSRLRHHSGKNL
jgi:hypothetical protein